MADPIYGYNPQTEAEDDFRKDGVIAVMAIDNLPCELPRDASKFFGDALIDNVFPVLFSGNDPDRIIERAAQTDFNGNLTPNFHYLKDYVNGVEVTG